MNFVKKKHILIGVLVICALIAFYLFNDTYIETIDVDNYAFESLLGKSRNEVINIFGENYIETDQGDNQKNIDLNYDEVGVLVGLDYKNDKVIKVQLKDVEYKGISTKLRMGTADEIMDMEMLTINFNPGLLMYVYDFGSYKVGISGQSRGAFIEELVVFKEGLK